MLQQAITNTLETSENTESLSIKMKAMKKNQMEKVELKDAITVIKCSVDGLNSRIEETEERIRKLEDKIIQITQSDNRKKNNGKK